MIATKSRMLVMVEPMDLYRRLDDETYHFRMCRDAAQWWQDRARQHWAWYLEFLNQFGPCDAAMGYRKNTLEYLHKAHVWRVRAVFELTR